MYYFINYKMFPAFAKYKAIWWYAATAISLICFYLFWLYTVDAHIKNAIALYEKKLTELEFKKSSFAAKKNTIASLTEQKDNLSLHISNEQKKVLLLWRQPEDFFNTYALSHFLIIETISISKQSINKTFLKKSISLSIEGSLNNILLFLEDIEKNGSFLLDQFNLQLETENKIKVNCLYTIQKIKTLQL